MAITCDGTCLISDGETKISTGKQQKQGGESAINSNMAGKHIFLAGHLFTLAGQSFSRVVTGGCFPGKNTCGVRHLLIFIRNLNQLSWYFTVFIYKKLAYEKLVLNYGTMSERSSKKLTFKT